MKKLLFLALTVFVFNSINARNAPADSLQEYTGKYKFPEGTPFSEVIITLQNGTLTATSETGSSDLKRREGDTFDIVAYNGTAIFKRNEAKKINKVQLQVHDLDVEGDKTEEGALSGITWRYRN